jgi:hypothetical protein
MNDRDLDRWSSPPDQLRAILRRWRAPETPPGIEDDLRRAFRRRRRPGRTLALGGLAVAASLVIGLVAVIGARQGRRPPALVPAPSSRPAVSAADGQNDVPAVPSAAPAARSSTSRVAGGGRLARPPQAPRVQSVVEVEPGQAALLAQLARDLGRARAARPAGPAPPPASMPLSARPDEILQAPARDEPQPYRSEWRRIDTEWPFVHRSL